MRSLDPYTVPFFRDYLLILRRVEKTPIKLTKKEKRFSLVDVAELVPQFVQQESIEEHKKYGWGIRLERDIDFLEQARVMMEVNGLVAKRKDRLYLTREGRSFLTDLPPLEQYVRMVHAYWEETNWDYFHFGVEVNGRTMTKLFQGQQVEIWRAIQDLGYAWSDFRKFCEALDRHFDLKRYKGEWDTTDWLRSDVYYALFRDGLVRLGCVEVERSKGGHEYLRKVEKFRLTYLGLYVLERYLNYFKN